MKTLATALNQKQDEDFYTLTHGIDVDQFLFKEEIAVQKAWIKGLADANLISQTESVNILSALQAIECEMQNKTFRWIKEDEDIHMNIERAITERLGDLGKKLHHGRSRNDLVATTLKLYLANRCAVIANEIKEIAFAVLTLSDRDINIILPAYTHSQAAQPIRLSQIWNFHVMNFKTDVERFKNCCQNLLKIMPLGCAAVAGTHINIDLAAMAKDLGFHLAPVNSVHGVSDRDGAIEMAQTISLFGLHISRFCEDIIFLSSSSMKVLQLSPSWSSGSSIMPNKRNPDFFEILRAKAKKLMCLGNEVLFLNAGISSGYSSDFHEQKRILVNAVVDMRQVLPIIKKAFVSVTTDCARANELLLTGHILSTDVANDLVSKGSTFRDAYREVAGNISEGNNGNIQIGADFISFEASVENRNNSGGTSIKQVFKSIHWLKEMLTLL